MKTPFPIQKMSRLGLSLVVLSLLIFSCKQKKEKESAEVPIPKVDTAISVVTENMDFQLPDTIKAGWQTFRYSNHSKDPHFLLLEKYPDSLNIENTRTELIPTFQEGMNQINEGDMDAAMKTFGTLPEWFPQIVFLGGTGLISPGETAVSTLHMEPGYYVIECYVKSPEGVFHSALGMLEDLVVTRDSVDFSPPAPTVSVYISTENGLEVAGPIEPGLQVFAVNFVSQGPHENFTGHDVNLVKLGEGANLDELAAWMNWIDPKGLITPPPAGVTFLGGVNDMPAGYVGFFTADLVPGNYALISEVPDPVKNNMLKTFTIPEASNP